MLDRTVRRIGGRSVQEGLKSVSGVLTADNPPDTSRAFLARAIAQEAAVDANGAHKGTWKEGFSVCFYGATADEAKGRAEAWIEAERVRATETAESRAAAADKQRKPR